MASINEIITDNEEIDNFTINRLLESTNIAEELNKETLAKIGAEVVEGFNIDEGSRQGWLENNEEWLDLALQIAETKSTPWPDAANVKYPLITTSAVQFGSRAYPALIKGTDIVRGKVTGKDPDGEKLKSAQRISKHMSYQVLEEMTEWEEDMDRLTISVPIAGCIFKKTYFDPLKKRNVSPLVHAKNLSINYYAASLETAIRKTHILEMNDNDLFERKRAGLFLDVELGKNTYDNQEKHIISDKVQGTDEPNDKSENTPRVILEQHTFLDLDEDGYKEPYVVTVDKTTKKVLRIIARFDANGVTHNEAGELVRIDPVEYFTKYSFIPNPDGGIYDVGFGILLGSINKVINTIINLLLDAGTLSNMQSGFISRSVRLKKGNRRFTPGEWKTVNASGTDLKNGILPLPVREPSQVLFLLLGTILESGERLASVVDILVGENPGQNQAATTTLAVIEQGLKVFTAIHKRLYRSLTSEFKKIYRLNGIYLDEETYHEVLDSPDQSGQSIFQTDYRNDGTDVQPSADPNIATEMQAIIKAQGLIELIPTGKVNPDVAIRRMLEAMDQPKIDEIMEMPEVGPNFDQQIALKELELKERELDQKDEATRNEAIKDEADSVLKLAKAHAVSAETQFGEIRVQLEALNAFVEAATPPKETAPTQGT